VPSGRCLHCADLPKRRRTVASHHTTIHNDCATVVKLTTFKNAQAIDLYKLFQERCQESLRQIGKRSTPPVTPLEQMSPFAAAKSVLTVTNKLKRSGDRRVKGLNLAL